MDHDFDFFELMAEQLVMAAHNKYGFAASKEYNALAHLMQKDFVCLLEVRLVLPMWNFLTRRLCVAILQLVGGQ